MCHNAQLIEFNMLLFIQNYLHGSLPRAFAGTWSSNQERRGAELHVSLRNNEDLYVPLARTITADRMPVTEFPRAWNNFTEKQIKQEQSTKIFKTKLKNFFMDKLSHIPICSRANCTACH